MFSDAASSHEHGDLDQVAMSGVRQSFEPFRKRVPSFDAPLHRSVATLRLTGSPALSEADDVALAKGAAKGGGVQSVWVPSAGILCGCPSSTKSNMG